MSVMLRLFAFAVLLLSPDRLLAATPIVIGLDADMSAVAAEGGQAIKQGALIAIHELNEAGGVLGRPIELRVKDHRGNPARGVDNIDDLATDPNVVAILSGVHTPVALRELDAIHHHGIPFLVPWAAGTIIIDNGFEPNFAFRLSVRDEHAGDFLVAEALKAGYRKPGLLLEQTPWGMSNFKAMTTALSARGVADHPTEWVNWGAGHLRPHITALRAAGVDVILLVSNAPEAAATIETLAALPEEDRLPIISHWGITGGDFPAMVGQNLEKVQLSFLQTFSFFNPPEPAHAQRVLDHHCQLFTICDPVDIDAPVGLAHAYDLVHILARAIKIAGTADRSHVRDALEQVRDYDGLMGSFPRPFDEQRHDALNASSFQLGYFDNRGTVRPSDPQRRPGS